MRMLWKFKNITYRRVCVCVIVRACVCKFMQNYFLLKLRAIVRDTTNTVDSRKKPSCTMLLVAAGCLISSRCDKRKEVVMVGLRWDSMAAGQIFKPDGSFMPLQREKKRERESEREQRRIRGVEMPSGATRDCARLVTTAMCDRTACIVYE